METRKDSSIENPPADSGYNSPKHNGVEIEPGPNTGAPIPFTKDTYIFKKKFDESAFTRSQQILPVLEKLLLSKFGPKKETFWWCIPLIRRLRLNRRYSMVIRCLVIGKTEAEAKESLVIICHPSLCKSVEYYLQKDDLIKQLFEPNDISTPSLELVVRGDALKFRGTSSDFNVHCDSTDLSMTTFCGLALRFTDCDGASQCGTFGGIVKVTSTNGGFGLFGMTSAHALTEWYDSESDLDDDLNIDTAHISENRAHIADSLGSSSFVQASPQGPLVSSSSRAFDNSFELGNITAESGDDESLEGPYLDWALFSLKYVRPNHLPNSTEEKSFIAAPAIASADHDDISVIMIGNSQNCRGGKISGIPSRIMLGAGTSFTDAFLLTLDEGTVLDGESGAWVVASATFEVYGHVIATDVFGGAYVIPMQSALTDMQRLLGAKSVALPNDHDLIQLHSRVSGENDEEEIGESNVITRSKAVDSALHDVASSGPSVMTTPSLSQTSAASLFYGEMPPKPIVATTKNLPAPITRDTLIRTYIETKNDSGDFSAALTYEPEKSDKRITARKEDVQNVVNVAISRLG